MDSTHKLKLGVLKEEIRGEDGNPSPHTDSLARCLSLGLLRCHAPLQLLLSSSPPVVISFPRHHVFPSFASPPFYSALVSPFTLVSSHFFYLFSMSVALMVISCCPPRLQCCVTSLEVWKDDLALCLHFFSFTPKSYTPPAVPFPSSLFLPCFKQPVNLPVSALLLLHPLSLYLIFSSSVYFVFPALIVLLHYQMLSQCPLLCHPGYL